MSVTSILERSAKDASFRAKLLKEPIETLRSVGETVSADSDVLFVNGQRNQLHVILDEQKQAPGFQKVVDKASNDAEFRKMLLENPKAVLSEQLGESLPLELEVLVHQTDGRQRVVVLPPLETDDSLSDSELEAVTGGTLRGLLTRIGDAFCGNTSTSTVNQLTNNYTITTDYSSSSQKESGSLIVW